MRTTGDLPRRRSPRANRSWLVAAVAIAFFGLTSLRGIASFYTTYLWFRELDLTGVWRGVLGTKVVLAAVFTLAFFLLLYANLVIAERLAPRFRPLGPEDELVQRYRETVGPHAGKVRLVVAGMFALLAGTGSASRWNDWLLFRNSVPFGVRDPQFGEDVSWFVFRLPFLTFVVNWAFVAVVIVAVVTVVAHYLNGGIRVQSPGARVTPQVKAHISVLLAALALLRAVGYYLQRYELAYSTRGAVQGATYTDVNAQLPALQLLVLISLAAVVLFILNIWRQGWVLPVIAVGLWAFISIVVGGIYPAFIQKFRVEPNEIERERPYIARNIRATRAAFGIDRVRTKAYPYTEQLQGSDLDQYAGTIRNVRLWDPEFVDDTYQRLQEIRQYYRFNDVDVDRYEVDGQLVQTIVSARELNQEDLPSQSWVNRHLQFTHGYGAVVSPANAVTAEGQPAFLVRDVPPQGRPAITQPSIYYGEGLTGYAIVRTRQREIDYQTREGETRETSYRGTGGVPMGSVVRRAAFALRFGDINPLISSLITPESRAIFMRDIRERVRTAAPFLRYDADPYPVVLSGRIVWVQDAYTVTARYPYSQQARPEQLEEGSGLRTGFNYVRNSVKVVIDAYDGSLTFYVVDARDPLVRAYSKAFPGLFTPGSEMNEELRAHLRYPEDLFRVQTTMYGQYHITDASEFYRATDRWDVAQDPGSGRASAADAAPQIDPRTGVPVPRGSRRMAPTYLLLRLPDDARESFLILRPFVAASQADRQQNLTAFMVAKSDPGSYGTLEVFEMPRGSQIDSPVLIDSRIKQDAEISKEISLLDQRGSEVLQGNILVLPIKESLLYVRPLYVQSERNPLPELKRVVVAHAERTAMGVTLKEALEKLFGSAPATLEEQPAEGQQPGEAAPPPPPAGGELADLLAQAQAEYDAAQAALRAGDLAAYQQHVNRMADLLRRARESAGGQGGGAPTTTTTMRPSTA